MIQDYSICLDYVNSMPCKTSPPSSPVRQDAAPETREAYIVKNRDMQRSRFWHIRQIGWWGFAHTQYGWLQ